MDFHMVGTGSFKLEGRNLSGILYFNDSRSQILLDIILNEDQIIAGLFLPKELDFISGKLINGFKLTLMSCSMMSFHMSTVEKRYRYKVDFMLEGINITESANDLFKQIDFMMPDIIPWIGESLYYETDQDNHIIIQINDSKSIKFFEYEGYRVNFKLLNNSYPIMRESLLVNEIKLTQDLALSIQSDSVKPFKEFLKVFDLCKRFIEIGVRRTVGVSRILAFPSSDILVDNGMTPINVTGILINKEGHRDNLLEQSLYMFTLADVLKYCNIETYLKNSKKLRPVLDLYLMQRYKTDIPMSVYFLHMVQALEALHSRFYYDNFKDFKKHILESLEKLNSGLDERDEKIYYNYFDLGKRRQITLRNRLSDFLICEPDIFSGPHFYTGDICFEDFPFVIVKIRNYLTHYNENYEDEKMSDFELKRSAIILEMILEYYIMECIGFKDIEFRTESYNAIKNYRKLFLDY